MIPPRSYWEYKDFRTTLKPIICHISLCFDDVDTMCYCLQQRFSTSMTKIILSKSPKTSHIQYDFYLYENTIMKIEVEQYCIKVLEIRKNFGGSLRWSSSCFRKSISEYKFCISKCYVDLLSTCSCIAFREVWILQSLKVHFRNGVIILVLSLISLLFRKTITILKDSLCDCPPVITCPDHIFFPFGQILLMPSPLKILC